MCFRKIAGAALDKSVAEAPKGPAFMIGGWGRLDIPNRPLWEYNCEGSVAFARAKNAVLFAGPRPQAASTVFAIDIKTGESLWKRPVQLHAPPVLWGIAIDRDGRIITALKDGHVMCFGPAS
jgi:hypothetical protein